MAWVKEIVNLLSLASGLWMTQMFPAEASPIPANDGVGTSIIVNGDRFDIMGGQLSGDQANLFHSFQQFGLTQEQVANFLSNPQIQNILVRVSGGDISVINGLLQVSGGASNLLFMNPAGIVFGPNATLNLPADFIATTANRLEFGGGGFNAIGDNAYATLMGNPTGFTFAAEKPAAILNFADLSVQPGHQLGLLGGTIASAGRLSAPGGDLIVTTVPGKHAVRISQPGSLLQLEIALPADVTELTSWNLPITSLPELLTGIPGAEAGSLQSSLSSELGIAASPFELLPGDLWVQSAIAGNAELNAAGNLTAVGGELRTDGDLRLAARQNLQLRDTQASQLTIEAGRDLVLQGNQGVDILALSHNETSFASGRDLQIISRNPVSGDAHFSSGRHFAILDLSDLPGDFISLYDPIISASGNVLFGNYTGASLKIEATGSITGGNVSITGPDVGLTGTDPDIPLLVNHRAVILRAGVDTLQNSANLPQTLGGSTFGESSPPAVRGNISVGNLNTGSFSAPESGVIIVSTDGDITAGNLGARRSVGSGGSIDVATTGGRVTLGNVDASSSLNDAGRISIVSFGDVTTGTLNTQANGVGGPIAITSNNGNIQTGNITANTFSSASVSTVNNGQPVVLPGDGGAVTLNALGNIFTGEIRTSTDDGFGGLVSLSSALGNVSVGGDISSFTIETGNGGNVSISAFNSVSVLGNISTSAFTSSSSSSSGGNVSISSTSSSSSIAIANVSASGRSSGGQVILNAAQVSSGSISNFSSSNFRGASGNSFLRTPTEDQTPSVASFTAPPSLLALRPTDSLEDDFTSEFEQYFGRQFPRRFVTTENIRSALYTLDTATKSVESGGRTAVVYVSSVGSQAQLRVETSQGQAIDRVVVNPTPVITSQSTSATELSTRENGESTIEEPATGAVVGTITRDELEEAVRNLHREIQRPESNTHLSYAAQLYDWLIRPIETALKQQDIGMLLFSMESGLRLIPLAALYDRETGQFLGEKYQLSIIPNFGSVDVRYTPPEVRSQSSILAMGASEFGNSDVYSPLNAVPLELAVIEDIWHPEGSDTGQSLFAKNQDFTLETLRNARRNTPFQIVHLATHATFLPGDPSNSSIQLWGEANLPLNQLQIETLNWNNPPIDLLILSACQTALGDAQAELGFAGLSLQAEVKSTLASLWYVSDLGSLIYMMEFYRNLLNPNLKTKAAVVQATQLSLLNRQRNFQNLQELDQKISTMLEANRVSVGSDLTSSERQGLETLQATIQSSGSEIANRLTHPFYWSSFTLVGSPW